MLSAFKGPNGQFSMRRLLAFIYAIASIVLGTMCLHKSVNDWKIIAVAFGIPSVISVILLLFTTWGDLTKTIDSVRGNKKSNDE